jgi:hypothetical protein
VYIIEDMQSRQLERAKYISTHPKVCIDANPLSNPKLHKMLEQLSFTDFLYLPNVDKKTQDQIIDNYKGSY